MPRKLYHSFCGRCLLKVLTLPFVSKTAGLILSTRLSKLYIKSFIKKNDIDMNDFEKGNYNSFNDFFVRKIRDGKRSIDLSSDSLISPCDGYLSVYDIDDRCTLNIKDTVYTLGELFENSEFEGEYQNGKCLVFRLTPADYHRYIYPDNGTKEENIYINGIFHTVRPVALKSCPVFKTNSREYTTLHTENFGDILFMEVGAMLVGKICNHHNVHSFKRGDEKGYFEFGGSTIIMMLKKDAAIINNDIAVASLNDSEYKVGLGQKIGTKAN